MTTTDPYLMCDDLDDLRDSLGQLLPPRVLDVPRGYAALAIRARAYAWLDMEFLRVVDPAHFLALGQAAFAFMRATAYQPTAEQGRVVRSHTIAAGVRDRPHRETADERVQREAAAWGLDRKAVA